MTQIEAIKRFIEENGSITPMQAFESLGITKLATRISEMIREGTPVYKSWEEGENRYGEKVRFMRYSLGEEDGIQRA
ncbi:MAG: hypothetical protein IKU36_13135 [Bacteroidales bacterium]|nr:hypothetical protein [Bacteroidales bacterium]